MSISNMKVVLIKSYAKSTYVLKTEWRFTKESVFSNITWEVEWKAKHLSHEVNMLLKFSSFNSSIFFGSNFLPL